MLNRTVEAEKDSVCALMCVGASVKGLHSNGLNSDPDYVTWETVINADYLSCMFQSC